MTSHHGTIARAAFSAACLRPDGTKLARDDVLVFQSMLGAAVLRCSPANVQKCKEWLLMNVTPSQHRTNAFGKYLTSLSKYLFVHEGPADKNVIGKQPCASRQRLHVLYLLNDVLHHVTHHDSSIETHQRLIGVLQENITHIMEDIVQEVKPRVGRRIQELLQIWEQERYFDENFVHRLRQTLDSQAQRPLETASGSGRHKRSEELPYIMPATHGDPDSPYYDLPAANLMPHIVPNQPIPIRPNKVRALQLAAGPADEALVNAVKDFLKDVERLDDPFATLEKEGITVTMDELGQITYRNQDDELAGETYYGWSREFCQKMKSHGQSEKEKNRRRSRSSSMSRSISPGKRRRRHSRSSSDGSRSRSADWRRRSESYSPPRGIGHASQQAASSNGFREKFGNYTPAQHLPGPNMMQPPSFPLPSLTPTGMPIPPPRPRNWQGPWPPPPPPPPPTYPGIGVFPLLAFSPPPPPPF